MKTEFVALVAVPGRPVAQGSMSAFVRGKRAVIMDQKSKTLKPWRKSIFLATQKQIKSPLTGSVKVKMTFQFLRPKNQLTTKLKPTREFKLHPHVKPDLDKLARAVLDGLTGAAFKDDAQVVSIDAIKTYGESEGVYIVIERVVK